MPKPKPNTPQQSPDLSRPPARQERVPANGDPASEECERLVDSELVGTFPASDAPSWTLGGSHVSTLRR